MVCYAPSWKTDKDDVTSRDAIRKAREAYLIEGGQTLEPKGINKREET